MAKSKTQVSADPLPTARPGGGAASRHKKSTSKSSKAGLAFPVARVNRRMLELHKTTKRVGAGAPVYITAIVEYFTAELLELSINQMRGDGKGRSRITPGDVLKALRYDDDLHKATNGLRVMVGDKQKNASDLIICKTDLEAKQMAKMNGSDSFEVEGGVDVATNWKRYKKEAEEAAAEAEAAEAEA